MTTQTQARAVPRQRGLDEAWEHLTDALYTYCLSVLCDQDEAVAAVREVRRLSARHRRRLRQPALLHAWLYALARHCCLQRMESPGLAPGGPSGGRTAAGLADLTWPETADSTPAQREALELTGRHGLAAEELAAVLGLSPEQAGALVAQAVCEMERTAAALSVLDADGCPELRRIGRERGPVLGPALRGELVRHLDACPTCRGTAERTAALGPWPGTLRAPGALTLVHAPAELRLDLGAEGFFTQLGRRDDHAHAHEPRFDRRGFPVHRSAPSQRAALLRQRAIAGSVIAVVVAAPVVALWATHQRHTVEAAPVSSVSVATPEPAGPPSPPVGGALGLGGEGPAPVEPGPAGAGPAVPAPALPGPGATAPSADGAGAPATTITASRPPSRLDVTAAEAGGRTVITLADNGSGPIGWQIVGTTPWLRLSRDAGTLQPGGRITVLVTVDEAMTPADPWIAQLVVQPCGAVVTLQGPGTGRRTLPPPGSSPSGAPSGPAGPSAPSGPPSASPSGRPTSGPSAPPSSPPPSSTPSAPPATTPPPVASATLPPTDGQGRHRRAG